MHLNDLSKIYLDNIAEEAIDTDDITGLLKARDAAKDADEQREKSKKNNKQKKKEQKKAKKEVKQAKEDRREKLKQQQQQRVKDIKDRAKDASKNASRLKARATSRSMETINKDEGDASAVAKLGSNIVKGVASTADRIRSYVAGRKAQNLKKKLKTEEFIQEVDDMDSKEKKIGKIIDVMKGKNKIEVNPKLTAEGIEMEGVVDIVKKGAKRHSKAVQAKKIKNRKAVPYAALAAEHTPEGEELKEYSPNVTYQAKGGKKSGKLGKSSVYSLRDKDESKKEFRKSQVKDIKGGYLKTEDYYNEKVATGPRLGEPRQKGATHVNAGEGEKIQKRTLAWMRKKGMKGAPGLDAMKEREAEHKAKRGVKEEVGCETKKVENKGKKKIDPKKNPVVESKVDKGRSDYCKASIRNYRSKGPGYGEPAMFDPENKRGKLIDKRRADHKARRGVKGAKVPAYKVDENVTIQDANGNDFLEVVDLIKPEPIKSPKNNIKFEEAKKPEGGDSRPTVKKDKIDMVMSAVERERKRKNALQIQGIIGT